MGDESVEVPFEILPDPRSSTTLEELRAQFELHLSIRDELTRIHEEIGRLRELRRQIGDLEKRLKGHEAAEEIETAAEDLENELKEVEEALYQTRNQSRQDPLNYPIRLNDKLAGLVQVVSIGAYPPTDQMLAVRDELSSAVTAELEKLRVVWEEDVAAFNRLVREKEVDPILVPAGEE